MCHLCTNSLGSCRGHGVAGHGVSDWVNVCGDEGGWPWGSCTPQCPPQPQMWPLLALVGAHGSHEGAGVKRGYFAPVLGTISDSGPWGPLRTWGRQASSHAAGGDAEPEPLTSLCSSGPPLPGTQPPTTSASSDVSPSVAPPAISDAVGFTLPLD